MTKNLIVLMVLIPLLSFSQTKITGNISSKEGSLPGVNVIEKGTQNGTTTDIDGNYQITVKDNATLMFSFVGYKTQNISTNNKSTINVALKEDSSQLKEVVVKGFAGVIGQARRRAESVQNIPESVITYTSKDIENTGIENLKDFSSQVPNMSFNSSQSTGVNYITVRGIPQIRNGDAPVAYVIDGVTVPDANLLNQELFDIAMVEVVKGPQGALYGKNAIAGAINIVTKKPTNSFSNKIVLGYANGNTMKAQGIFSGPIVKDKVYYRASGAYKKSDGLFYNVTNKTKPDYYDDINLRGQLMFNITRDFKATVSGQYSNHDGGSLYYHIPPNHDLTVPPNDLDKVVAESDVLGTGFLKNFFGYLKLEYNFENMKLTAITSYNDAKRNDQGDLDHSSASILLQYQDSNSKVFNQEFRLSSKDSDSKISWDLGGFYQKNEKLLTSIGYLASDTSNPLLSSDFTNTYNTLAFSGFIDYKIIPKLTLSAGLRYDNDNIKQTNRTLNITPQRTDSQLQPKFSISYKPYKSMLLYANYGKGYRVGGFNGNATELFDAEYSAEVSDSYELGLKSSWWNNRLIFNTAVFYTDLYNQQQYGLHLAPPNIILGNYNYKKSKISGFEASIKLRASNYLDILAGYGMVSAQIEDGGTAGTVDRSNLKGVNTPFVPQNNYSIALQSNFPVSDNIDFNGNISLKEKGKVYWHEDLPDLYSPSYTLLDIRAGISINKKIGITLWASNIFDTKYAEEFYSSQAAGGGGQDLIWLGNPATYGIDINYKF